MLMYIGDEEVFLILVVMITFLVFFFILCSNVSKIRKALEDIRQILLIGKHKDL